MWHGSRCAAGVAAPGFMQYAVTSTYIFLVTTKIYQDYNAKLTDLAYTLPRMRKVSKGEDGATEMNFP
jgi:hypothetical protein